MTKYIKNSCKNKCLGDGCPTCEAYHNSGDSTCPCCGHETLGLASQHSNGDLYTCSFCGYEEVTDGEDEVLAEVRCPECNRLLCYAELGMTVSIKCPRCKWHGRITVNINF